MDDKTELPNGLKEKLEKLKGGQIISAGMLIEMHAAYKLGQANAPNDLMRDYVSAASHAWTISAYGLVLREIMDTCIKRKFPPELVIIKMADEINQAQSSANDHANNLREALCNEFLGKKDENRG